jgi:prephenate dehydrogenase
MPSLAKRLGFFFIHAHMNEFQKITVLGPGLLGGSIALAVRKYFPGCDLCLWGRSQEFIDKALHLGIHNATSDFHKAVKDADLIILATPVGVMRHLVEKMNLDSKMLVTDVGSVKRIVHASLSRYFIGRKAKFIGSHPMAGSEKTGLIAAREDLLAGAACIITNDESVDQTEVDKLCKFWQGLGMKTRELSAEDHDYAVARISHFPHMLASVGATVGLAYEDIVHLAGGGMRDTTRVAAGDPSMWTEIIMENSDALQRSIGECIHELIKVQEMLRNQDSETLLQYLKIAKYKRELIA